MTDEEFAALPADVRARTNEWLDLLGYTERQRQLDLQLQRLQNLDRSLAIRLMIERQRRN